MTLSLIEKIIFFSVPIIFAITLHEAAHGFVAKYFGDDTAYVQGRVSLNPLRHIDPIGTVLVPLIFLLLPGNFLFGWAKPVPVNFNALRSPKKHMLWVAAAGPAANLVMAFGWAFIFSMAPLTGSLVQATQAVAVAGIIINVMLMVLNLLPILPLDGGRIAMSLLPDSAGRAYSKLEPYGIIIVVALLISGVLGRLLGPLIDAGVKIITGIFSLQGSGLF